MPMRKSRALIVAAAVVLVLGCAAVVLVLWSGPKRDSQEIQAMQASVLLSASKALEYKEGQGVDLRRVEWLKTVASALGVEAGYIRTSPGETREQAMRDLAKHIHLRDYNRTLREVIPGDQFARLGALRKKYAYEKYVDPAESR